MAEIELKCTSGQDTKSLQIKMGNTETWNTPQRWMQEANSLTFTISFLQKCLISAVSSDVLGANLQMSVESILHGRSLRELLVEVADFCFTPLPDCLAGFSHTLWFGTTQKTHYLLLKRFLLQRAQIQRDVKPLVEKNLLLLLLSYCIRHSFVVNCSVYCILS